MLNFLIWLDIITLDSDLTEHDIDRLELFYLTMKGAHNNG